MESQNFSKTNVGERREYRKNGDIYVYERITAYDKKTQKSVTISQKLKGKILAGTLELIPTRPKKKRAESTSIQATRKHTGLTDILEWIGRESGIDSNLLSSFGIAKGQKIASIARYWTATDGQSLPRIEGWQRMHDLPYASGISEDVYGTLFRSIGLNESSVQSYFYERASRLTKSSVIAFDSTTISTYSENLHDARQGFNKDGDGLNTIKLLTLYSVKDREPIAFAKQPGNIPDVISIQNTLSQLKALDLPKPLIVTDNGYYSEKNMLQFSLKNIKFLTLVDPKIKWVSSAIDSVRDTISDAENSCPFDLTICGKPQMIEHTFSAQAHEACGLDYAKQPITKRLYVHVFYSSTNYAAQEHNFREELLALKTLAESDTKDIKPSAQRKIDRFLRCSRAGRTGALTVSFNNENIREAKRNFGYFACVSNQVMDTFTALEDYRLRERIEELFKEQKGSFDGSRPRVWSPERLRGRHFVQFVGLGYSCFFSKRLKEVRQKLGVDSENKTKALLKLEKQLAQWIDSHSVAQIYDWFDCVETTTIQNESSKVRWSTESISRDKLFLQYLGVIS